MKNFTFHNPTKIVFGTDAMDQIASNTKPYGRKVFVVYGGGSIKTNGVYQKVMDELKDFEVREFSGITPNPRLETVVECLDANKDFNPDFILAVGGGSVIDAVKLIASAWHYEGDPWDFLIDPETVSPSYIPFGAVLTLSATGSEMNAGSVITNVDKKIKTHFKKDETYPRFSILDPQNLYTLPADQTAYGVIDTFSHVLEQYIHTLPDVPLQDRWSEGIMLTLIENALKAQNDPKNYTYRANIMLSATMALNGLVRMGTNEDWATHRIEHEISAFYDIPHAAGLAIITPRWMKVVKAQKFKKLVQYGKRVWNLKGSDDEIVNNAIDKTFEFFKSLGVKMNLSEWEIDDKHFPTMIERLVEGKVGEKSLTESEIKEILEMSLK